MNTIAIIQPSFLPWIGYFQIISSCDQFIFYDDVQYDKRSWRNRNKIMGANGPQWLTVPVKNKGLFEQKINHTEIDYSTKWISKAVNSIRYSYAKTPFFDLYFPWLEKKLQSRFETISDLDISLTEDVCSFLEIKTKLHRSSLTPRPEGTDKIQSLIFLCKSYSASKYISGPSAFNYIGTSDAFHQSKIELQYAKYIIPADEKSDISIIDFLFRYGPYTKRFTQNLQIITPQNLAKSLQQ